MLEYLLLAHHNAVVEACANVARNCYQCDIEQAILALQVKV